MRNILQTMDKATAVWVKNNVNVPRFDNTWVRLPVNYKFL